MTIPEIYKAAKERGLVSSLRRFSREFLGRAPNYASDRDLDRCSAAALLNLYRRLGDAGQARTTTHVCHSAIGGDQPAQGCAVEYVAIPESFCLTRSDQAPFHSGRGQNVDISIYQREFNAIDLR